MVFYPLNETSEHGLYDHQCYRNHDHQHDHHNHGLSAGPPVKLLDHPVGQWHHHHHHHHCHQKQHHHNDDIDQGAGPPLEQLDLPVDFQQGGGES